MCVCVFVRVTSSRSQQSGHTRRVNEVWAAYYGDSLGHTFDETHRCYTPVSLGIELGRPASDCWFKPFSSQKGNYANVTRQTSRVCDININEETLAAYLTSVSTELLRAPLLTLLFKIHLKKKSSRTSNTALSDVVHHCRATCRKCDPRHNVIFQVITVFTCVYFHFLHVDSRSEAAVSEHEGNWGRGRVKLN